MAYTKYPIRPIARQLMLAALSWLMVAAVQAQSLVPLRDVAAISTCDRHTCALSVTGGVKCWGFNGDGALGDGSVLPRLLPENVFGMSSGVASITTGAGHTCAMTTDGGAKCWGYNGRGRLGDGSTTSRLLPTQVQGLSSGVTAISAGDEHTCALITGGGAKCWGNNILGQLGDGSAVNRFVPTDVTGLGSGVMAISAGGFHTCSLTAGGAAKCWGSNSQGQLGDDSTTGSSVPIGVTSLGSGTVAISAGRYHTCALTVGGGVKCWGRNSSGQLGSNDTANRLVPTDVAGLSSGVIAVSAGGTHTCALTMSGGVKCWGSNLLGQLGDDSTTDRLAPTDVSGLSNGVVAISTGYFHTCALGADGGVKCWGYNGEGPLGDGTTITRLVPTDVLRLSTQPAELWIRIERLSDSVTKRGVETRQYRIEALNLGSEAASATQVTAVLSGLSNIQWTCDAPTGCTPTEGMSPVSSQFDLASGELARVTLEGEVLPDVAFIDLAAHVSTSSGGGAQARHGLSETANGIGVLKDGFE